MSVSIDNPSPPSETDLLMQASIQGGNAFLVRMQSLLDAKARHDEALAELNLGRTAAAALADAQAKQVDGAQKQADADAMFAQANAVLRKAQADAADTSKAAQAEAAALIAQAQRDRDEAATVKASADAVLAAANADRQQLQTERKAVNRLGDRAEQTRVEFLRKAELLHAYLATAQAELAELSATAPAAAVAVPLAS
jgi:hypothetical protein